MRNSVGYNLFRSTADLTMLCAVPMDCPVPSFIDRSGWIYESKIENDYVHPTGFLPTLARRCSDLNGFTSSGLHTALRAANARCCP